jgi:hypothetical protein
MCGKKMPKDDADNALSRRYNVYICSDCGNNEAMRDFYRYPPLPPSDWYANPVMLMSMNDGVLFTDDLDENGYIIPKWDPRYRRH